MILIFLAHGLTNGVQYQVHYLLCTGLIGANAVAVKIPNYGQDRYHTPCLVWMWGISIAHLLLDLFSENSQFSRFLYL